ncbi:2-hydroxyacid dehydrogenase [Pendulispora albinea]|uniref:Glyoxylate/hydroxypyruvate reductase A n=1 Tax=Pendulispora albinea TaxID=2741071 RepID=A0ABZ2M3V2_9BACT
MSSSPGRGTIAVVADKNLTVVVPILASGLPEERIEAANVITDPSAVDIVVSDGPFPGALKAFPGLRLVVSLWAGVDHLLTDPDLPPHALVTRLVDANLTAAMVEAVLAHVLAAHRQHDVYRRAQGEKRWAPRRQPLVSDRVVGVLGLGTLGTAAAHALRAVGFQVHGWSRTHHDVPDIEVRTGDDGLRALLERADILVNLLPLTPTTRGILCRETLSQLPQGAVVINVARGAHLVERDLLALLDSGHLRHAVLDVHATEPLPEHHPSWAHPRIDVFPHVAGPTDPATAAERAVETILAFRAGRPLTNLVGR